MNDVHALTETDRLETHLNWDDLVLSNELMQQLEVITASLKNRRDFSDGRKENPQNGRGLITLFYGPPGTGKTLTATLLGKQLGLDVYRVDLAQMVSKYIGETEKNLGTFFDTAAEKNWILFFDEADALFGKRSTLSTSNDRYANQEVAYFLHKIEDYDGIVILATNQRTNIDDAISRRFQMALDFTHPDAKLRDKLWNKLLKTVPSETDIDAKDLAQNHKLSGRSISTVVRHATILAAKRGSKTVTIGDIQNAIHDELNTEKRKK